MTRYLTGLVVVCLMGFLACSITSAAMINYRLKVDGVLANQHTLVSGTTFTLTIEANVPDSSLGGGNYGGVLLYAVNLLDSTGTGAGSILVPKDADSDTKWDSLSYSPLNLNVAGLIDVATGEDVYAQTGSIVPYSNTSLGAGPGVWSAVGSGDFLYNGGTALLTVQPYALSGQRVWGPGGSEAPTSAGSYSTTITPEPASLGLLGLGVLSLLLRRRK